MFRRITKPLPGFEVAKTIPADLYDALELSADINGGIGAFRWFTEKAIVVEVDDLRIYDTETDFDCPVCINGHAAFVCGISDDATYTSATLRDAGITTDFNDRLVQRIKSYKDVNIFATPSRVTFKEYVTAGNIQRGDA